MPSDEMFYRDDGGKKRDAEVHEEILSNSGADKATRLASAKMAFARGAALDDITDLYGVNPLD